MITVRGICTSVSTFTPKDSSSVFRTVDLEGLRVSVPPNSKLPNVGDYIVVEGIVKTDQKGAKVNAVHISVEHTVKSG